MSQETKAPRNLDEIQKEYQSTCLRAGDLQYRIAMNSKDLDLINERLKELNFEALARKNLDSEKAAALAEAQASKKDGVKENV